jgi:hypothetical protein
MAVKDVAFITFVGVTDTPMRKTVPIVLEESV